MLFSWFCFSGQPPASSLACAACRNYFPLANLGWEDHTFASAGPTGREHEYVDTLRKQLPRLRAWVGFVGLLKKKPEFTIEKFKATDPLTGSAGELHRAGVLYEGMRKADLPGK